MGNKLLMAMIALSGAMVTGAETTCFRDSSGRLTGSVTTDGNGKTVYKDGQGRIQRTVTTDRNGKTTFRDNLRASQKGCRPVPNTVRNVLRLVQRSKSKFPVS